MLLTEYRQDFLEQLKVRASAAANFTHTEFVEVCAELLGDADEIADFEACYFRGTGYRNRSLGVDGFAQDDVDGSLRLVIAEFGGGPDAGEIVFFKARLVLRGCGHGAIAPRPRREFARVRARYESL